MKTKTGWPVLAGVLTFTLILGACGGPSLPESSMVEGSSQDVVSAASPVTKLTPEEAKDRMDQGDVTIVDVRTLEEYKEGHVPGAVLLPNDTINAETAGASLPDPDEVLLVYCRSGRRSAAASEKLVQLGYTQVYDFGGINDWPYDTETGAYTP